MSPRPLSPIRSWLEDAASDFRLGSGALTHLRYAVWGCGNSLYEANFNAVAKRVDRQLLELGARRFRPLGGFKRLPRCY